MSQDSGITIMTRLRVERSSVRITVGARDFSLFHNVQTGCGAYPASYTVGTGDSFLDVKVTEVGS
jgi:hypothetical protein